MKSVTVFPVTARTRLFNVFPVVALAAIIALVFGARLLGPHDLYEKDQPKTMAYTADVVVNHRFALPRDVIYQPSTKPPLYNWIDAVAVELTGRWDEWVLKIPSLLGALATGAIVGFMAARQRPSERWTTTGDSTPPLLLGCLAAGIWFTFGSDIRHGSVIRLAYLARPDMLQCAWLTGAWALATIAVERKTVRDSLSPAIGFWLCVTAAALTKGPAAAMPIVFAVAYAWLAQSTTSRLRNLLKLWPAIGVPILTVGVGTWLVFAYRQDPQHVKSVIFGAEIADRLIDKSPEGIAKPVYYTVMWFVTKTVPWGALALIGLLTAVLSRLFRERWLSATLYLIVVLACLSLPAGKRMDYLLPAYAPATVLVTGLAANRIAATRRRASITATGCVLIPLLLAVGLSHRFVRQFHVVDDHWSDHAVDFTRAVRQQVDTAKHRVLVLVRGKHPLTTLLGENSGSYLTRADLAAAEYVIAPLQPDWMPLVTSLPLPIGFETLETRTLAPLGLYHFAPGTAPVDRLIELQKQVGTWTADENPYHEPGTVYRD